MNYLTLEEIQKNKKNITKEKVYKTTNEIIISNTFTFFNALILVLALVVASTLHFENLLFVLVIVINTIIGIYQEIKSKNELEKLSLLNKSKYKVNRENKICEINIDEIVEGEYLHLNIGDQVPCDSIIINGEIEVDESLLTGESDNIHKSKNSNLMSGSNVVSGYCIAKVIAVGENSYINKLSKETKKLKKYPSKLREYLDNILKIISILLIPISIMLYFRATSQGLNHTETILKSAGALVGMIPEGLILLVSVSLAVSAYKLAKKKILVQELYCVETLARVDVLCFDKTGTITTGNMNVVKIEEEIRNTLENYLQVFDDENATSKALKSYLKLKKDWQIIKKGAFSSKNKYSYVQVKDKGTYFLGAYEFLGLSEKIDNQYENYKEDGYRIISLAHTEDYVDKPINTKILGHIVLEDEIKSNTKEIFDYFNNQGVEIKIISGDNHTSVLGVAKKSGFKKDAKAIDMSKILEKDFEKIVLENDIFGRVTPEQKEKMVKILQKNNKTVAMSGDGVNDVLALKKADISFAMNGATSAAKSVSNIVFLTDDFSVFYNILMEGRRVINNIQKVASLFLTKTFFSITFAILSVLLNLKFPFIPIQFTIISAITIGIPSFFLTFEENKQKVKNNFMKDVLTNAAIGGGALVLVVLIVNCLNLDYLEAGVLCFSLALINGLFIVAKVSFPFNKYKIILFILLIIGAILGVLIYIFILSKSVITFTKFGILSFLILFILLALLHTTSIKKLKK